MKKILSCSLVCAAAVLSGCTTFHTSGNALPLGGNVQTNVKATIDVGGKIRGRSSATQILFFTVGSDNKFADGVVYGANPNSAAGSNSLIAFSGLDSTLGQVKAAAAYNAMEGSGADVIVAPQYTVSENGFPFFKRYDVQVTGYKGTIKDVH